MNELQKPQNAANEITEPVKTFKGYTLEELRYQRAFVIMQREFCTTRLVRSVNSLKKSNPLSPGGATQALPGKLGFIASKVLSGMNYLDMALIGFSVFGGVRKVLKIFHRAKGKK